MAASFVLADAQVHPFGGYFTRLGPLGTTLQDADEATLRRVVDVVRPAFDPFVHGTEVQFDAACWMIGARSA